ncbi:oligopeptide/dipeptide ABC transporter ATP-binding protein [Oscillospiraceae bacterium MB08-C2-2]|nr:oligopeptide/dipeptide ABC transporter ATP-binding protein [Oscillospiraceae bacterium MB08-C2-2]
MDDSVMLQVENLKMYFPVKGSRGDVVHAVDGVSFSVKKGETLGIVGESGCGKSTVARTILRIYDPTEGKIYLDGQEIGGLNQRQLRPFRKNIQMIFQDPYASLNTRMVVRDIVAEPLLAQGLAKSSREADEQVTEMLRRVGLSKEHAGRYPHEFSGGQRQRIGIARALILRPQVVICDEPISALDVSIQAQIVNLLKEFQQEQGLTYLFIAHDLSMVRYVSDRVGVMYLGKLVELCESEEIYRQPLHPYTMGLMEAVPIADPRKAGEKTTAAIGGDIPSPVHPPKGCRFHTRCFKAQTVCSEQEPLLTDTGCGHFVACHFPGDAR